MSGIKEQAQNSQPSFLSDVEIMESIKREGEGSFTPPVRVANTVKKKLVPLFEEENNGLKKLARDCEDSKSFNGVVYETTIIRASLCHFLNLPFEEQSEIIKQYQKE